MIETTKEKIEIAMRAFEIEKLEREYNFVAKTAIENNIFNADEIKFVMGRNDLDENELQNVLDRQSHTRFSNYEHTYVEEEIEVYVSENESNEYILNSHEPTMPTLSKDEIVEAHMEQAKRDSRLWFAVEYGDVQKVKGEILNGGNVNSSDGWALFRAVSIGSNEMVKLLIDEGAVDHTYTKNSNRFLYSCSESALTASIEMGQLENLKLIESTSITSLFEKSSGYLLEIALKNGHTDIADYLINKFSDDIFMGNVSSESMKYVESKRLHDKLIQDMSRSDVPPISKKAQELIDSMRGDVGSRVVKQEPKHRMKI